jgi:SAM-dependent methyltransferase
MLACAYGLHDGWITVQRNIMSAHYTHGTDPAEQQRLTALNRLLNQACVAEAHLTPGERVLDLGAGLGQLSRAMARVTGVPVVGIERSLDQIREAERQAASDHEGHLLEMREGSVEAPPLANDEWGHYDVAHARFLLEHVPDPLAVVRTMVRAVRPGGRIILADDDYEAMRLWPEPPGFTPVWQAYQRTYDRHGNDPIVGRRLVQLLHQAGAQPRRNTWVFFGGCAGHPDFEGYAANLAKILEEAIDEIAETGTPPETVHTLLDALSAWRKRPDAAMWHGISWAEAARV